MAASTRLRVKDVNEVPVATYAKDKETVQKTVISLDGSEPDPSPICTKDIQRTATPFDKAVVPRMTPTLRAFLLEGKVAVVTGYVLPITHACISFQCLYLVLF